METTNPNPLSQFSLIIKIIAVIAFIGLIYWVVSSPKTNPGAETTISGTYVCLPHLDTTGPQTMECAFGIQTDDGDYYAVNFGASADAMEQFQSGSHVRALGSVVMKEALSSDQWQKYNIKGIFTVTKILESTPGTAPTPGAKLNIEIVCQSALAYMTFPDAASADRFIAECKEGKHPDVVQRYIQEMGLDGATI